MWVRVPPAAREPFGFFGSSFRELLENPSGSSNTLRGRTSLSRLTSSPSARTLGPVKRLIALVAVALAVGVLLALRERRIATIESAYSAGDLPVG